MNIRQLEFLLEIAGNGFNISLAAQRLHATQPGVSTQIRLLEEELGVVLFERNGKRLTGLTEAGRHIVALAGNVVRGTDEIKAISDEFGQQNSGTLVIATTHTQARYVLPNTILRFRQRYPNVQLRLRQGNPSQLCEWVVEGKADFAIATEAITHFEQLAILPCYRWNRCLVATSGHELLTREPLTLEAIADYPIITYDFAFTGRTAINKAFEKERLKPNVVLTAMDSDVIKTYVALGLGVGILAKMAFDAEKDYPLVQRDLSHLFEDSVTCIGFRRDRFLRQYMLDFIQLFAPSLNRNVVEKAIGSRRVLAPIA